MPRRAQEASALVRHSSFGSRESRFEHFAHLGRKVADVDPLDAHLGTQWFDGTEHAGQVMQEVSGQGAQHGLRRGLEIAQLEDLARAARTAFTIADDLQISEQAIIKRKCLGSK